jgi:hypothetical protein
LVTPYGAHTAAHAAGTCAIAVVVVTDAQGPAAALGREATVGLGRGDAVWMGVGGVPHDDTATTIEVTTTPARTLPLRTVPSPSSSVWICDGTRRCGRLSCSPAAPHAALSTSLASRSQAINHKPRTTLPPLPHGRCQGVTSPQLTTGSNAPPIVADG